jgi:hypothetical protein
MLLVFPYLHISHVSLSGLLLLFWREAASFMRFISGSGIPGRVFCVNALSRYAGALPWWAMPLLSRRTCQHVT